MSGLGSPEGVGVVCAAISFKSIFTGTLWLAGLPVCSHFCASFLARCCTIKCLLAKQIACRHLSVLVEEKM